VHEEVIYSFLFCSIVSENSLNWNEIYNLIKYCTEIFIALPYEYYHITDMLFNDLMVRFTF
jgi:hypothetical protein